MTKNPMLYIFGGLPASGKSTLAKELAKHIGALYIRIDAIEEAIIKFGNDVGPEAYEAAYSIASENLENGISVVADSVNSIEITRSAWRNVAISQNLSFKEIHITCSDKNEHEKRLHNRNEKSLSIRKLNWTEVINREFEPWKNVFLFDTASETKLESQKRLITEIEKTD